MGERKLDELRDHFDGADLSDAIESATWETETESDPMVVTSVRLPKSLLDWVRQQALDEHVKPTTLMRRWIEERRDATAVGATSGDASVARLADRVSRLETFAIRVVAGDRGDGVDSIAELLAALQASVDAAHDKQGHDGPDQHRRGA